MYTYRAKLLRVIDGDTVDMQVDFGFYLGQRWRLRLAGLNAPEVRGPERPKGLVATEFVKQRLEGAERSVVQTTKKGKYGRYIADIYYGPASIAWEEMVEEGAWLNEELIKAGHAVRVGG